MPAAGILFAGVGTVWAHGFGFGGFGGFGMMANLDYQTMFQSQADLLGVSVDEVKAAWAKGGKGFGRMWHHGWF